MESKCRSCLQNSLARYLSHSWLLQCDCDHVERLSSRRRAYSQTRSGMGHVKRTQLHVHVWLCQQLAEHCIYAMLPLILFLKVVFALVIYISAAGPSSCQLDLLSIEKGCVLSRHLAHACFTKAQRWSRKLNSHSSCILTSANAQVIEAPQNRLSLC